MEIKYLVDRPKDISKIVNWLDGQWGHYYESGKKAWQKKVNNRLNKEKVPTIFVAVVKDKVVGTASLIESDLDSRKDLSPWLADVFVLPDYRGNKIATKLVTRVLEEAKNIAIPKLYLFTKEAEELYKKLNWQTIEKFNHYGDQHTLMKYTLN